MISDRCRLSTAQYLGLQGQEFFDVLFRKHGLQSKWEEAIGWAGEVSQALLSLLPTLPAPSLLSILGEIVMTEGDLRDRAAGQYGDGAAAYHARWADLKACLALDNYEIASGRLRLVEPELQGAASSEDALTAEVNQSKLPGGDEIIRILKQSADHFAHVAPDYNACLAQARLALETLAKGIAAERLKQYPQPCDASSWGAVMAYLCASGLITTKEEKLICQVYGFLSDGAHVPVPVGLSEEERTRLGRGMAVSCAYLLIKRLNGWA